MDSMHGFGVLSDHCPMSSMGEGYCPEHMITQIDKNTEYSSHRPLGGNEQPLDQFSFLGARITPTWPPWYYYVNPIQQRPFIDGKDMVSMHGFGVADHCPSPMLNMGEGYYPEHLITRKDKNFEYSSHRPLGGFDNGDFPDNIDPWEMYITPVKLDRSTPEWLLKRLTDFSKLALDKYNYNCATKYQFAKLLKANCRGGSSIVYFITFQANYVARSRSKNFQAHLSLFRGEVEVLLCRPEP